MRIPLTITALIVLLAATPTPPAFADEPAAPEGAPQQAATVEEPGASSTAAAEPAAPAPEGAPQQAAGAEAPGPAPTAAAEPAAPAGSWEEIVVTATRSPRALAKVPVAVAVVSRDDMERSAAKTVDELLRVNPSFALFRRSSSVSADPSSQGVRLRGVGTSGVSRTLVLVDGVPVNDPFGGWVSWRSLPRRGLQRVEVAPAGSSALYGNYALGGVIQLLSRPIADGESEVTVEGGAMGTGRLSAETMQWLGPVRAALDGELFSSNGHPVVASWSRGAIDGDTPSKHAVVRGRVEGEVTPELSFALRGGYFWEDLNAGTQFTTAMVRRSELAGTLRFTPGEAGTFDFALFGHTGEFQQDRTSPRDSRNLEVHATHQDVPIDDVGTSLVWASRPLPLAGTHVLNVGTDVRWIRGETVEHLFLASRIRDAGGQQWLYGVFAQDNYDVAERVALNLAVRYDRWDNVAASRVEQDLTAGTTTRTDFPDRSGAALSPKVGVNVRALDWLRVRAAAYRSFRAPTLDELYRPFQVGVLRTEANEDLGPERLRGAEAGTDFLLGRLATRLTAFWNEIDGPIMNVTCSTDGACTIGTAPNLRQRRNLGTARIRGVEASGRWSFAPRWSLAAAYTYADSEVTSAPGQPQLVGKRIPQDPVHVASASLSYDDPRFLAVSAQGRYIGRQYEDDQNTRALGEVYLLDLFASWHATPRFDFFLAVENVLDRTYLVGRAGVDTIGQPRFVHGGVRLRVGG